LELGKSYRVPFLIGAIVVAVALETIIGEVHIVLLTVGFIDVGGGSQVTFVVEEYLVFLANHNPEPDVELSTSIEQGFL